MSRARAGAEFRFVTGRRCLDLVATLGHRPTPSPVERLDSPEAARRWLVAVGFHGIDEVGDSLVADLIALREAVFEAVDARCSTPRRRPGDAALGVLNRYARAEVPAPQLDWSDAGPVRGDRIGAPVHAVSLLAREAVDLLTGPDADRIRQCDAGTCSIWYVDSSRGRPRRWCDPRTCGNRERVADHRARRRGG